VVRDDVPNETQRRICQAFQVPGQSEVLEPFVARYLDVAGSIWEEKGVQRASTMLVNLFPRELATPQTLRQVDAWLESTDANPAAQRYVREGRADLARALAAQARDAR
jgi:aminopeptidase N